MAAAERSPCWAEAWVARRDGARAFLASIGLRPTRDNKDWHAALLGWRVPGWRQPMDDADLIALAGHYGWEGAHV